MQCLWLYNQAYSFMLFICFIYLFCINQSQSDHSLYGVLNHCKTVQGGIYLTISWNFFFFSSSSFDQTKIYLIYFSILYFSFFFFSFIYLQLDFFVRTYSNPQQVSALYLHEIKEYQ